MELGVLQEQAHKEIQRFEASIEGKDYDEVLFLYMSKISEDIGNLASGVMSSEGVTPTKNTSISSNFADALYSIIMLAKKMDVNLHEAMQEKIKMIEEEQAATIL
jgi:NTP pyrophosphatase (non-canonical NTP hydrolase)